MAMTDLDDALDNGIDGLLVLELLVLFSLFVILCIAGITL